MSYHKLGLGGLLDPRGTTPADPAPRGADSEDTAIVTAMTEPIYGTTGSTSRTDSRLPAPPPIPPREYTEYAAPLDQGPIGGPVGRRADGGACSQDGDCQSGACNTIEQKCYTPKSEFDLFGVPIVGVINTGSGTKYSVPFDKGGMLDTGGGGGGLPGDDGGGGGCPSGFSEVIGPDKLPHCCEGGKCCPGQHTVLVLDPTAEAGVGCACAPGYSVYDAKLNDCVKAAGDPPEAGGSGMVMVAGAAALALLLFRK